MSNYVIIINYNYYNIGVLSSNDSVVRNIEDTVNFQVTQHNHYVRPPVALATISCRCNSVASYNSNNNNSYIYL